MKIAFIPIDNRPVCYNLAKEIASIDNDLELFLPDKNLLGSLTSYADTKKILEWAKNLKDIDALIVSLDTIAHGGLISSRRSKDSYDEIETRLNEFKKIFEGKTKIYAVSSIMRISNNNYNEEEKEYWNLYGEKIFEYSYNFHKYLTEDTEVPQEIINDYLATRYRNYKVNKLYTEWFKEGFFNTLVYSKDDCAEFGLNIMEADLLKDILNKTSSDESTYLIKTGADEIPLSLLSRAVCDYNNIVPKISLKFLAPEYKDLISNYEDISIEKSIKGQLELANCKVVSEDNSDIMLLVNNFEEFQGEIVMGIETKPYLKELVLPQKPYMIADVRYANGSDKRFVPKLIKNTLDGNFFGFSAWNTSANTVGSLICAALVKLLAKDYNDKAFKKVQLVRFLDDWAYQSEVRQILKKRSDRPNIRDLQKLMLPYEKKIKKVLEIDCSLKYKFPWKRYFEVEVVVK